MVVGVLRVELHLPMAMSLKDKRSVVKSLKDQLRGRFNIAVAEIDANEKWQRASLGVAAVGDDRGYIDGCLREVAEWISASRAVELIRVEHELL
ncbi:MAG: DUF503 domain-containing protein [Candidatus Omnitrophica bacterium]|nr:DUF503 domain-containing protein [Candidatus Omnitrophota bacterium]